MSLLDVDWPSMNMGCFRYTILLFLGCTGISLKLSRILQGVTKAGWIAITQKKDACEEGTKHQEGPKSSEKASGSVCKVASKSEFAPGKAAWKSPICDAV
jgi:hypothetical protein